MSARRARRPAPRRRRAALALLPLAAAAAAFAPGAAHAASARAVTTTTLHFEVHVGPQRATTCDIVGDLYTPSTATPRHRAPAILTTNGFGGSKADQAGLARYLAGRGYVVLSYSGLGFGGSGCVIGLDDPDYDGRAASQLVSYLGGARGIAFTDAAHTVPAPALRVVVHDATDHLGTARRADPRVGMIGGSYGGEVQFAAAADDARVDTIVPLITWNDLAYSLDPNNADPVAGVSTANPGAVKLSWGALFSADGVTDGVQGAQNDPTRLFGCPNFVTFVCGALVTGASTGYFQPADLAALRHASVVDYAAKVRVPTLLVQGENDTLFNLNEASATFRTLRAQHTPVRMIWQSWGHSDLTPAPGEYDASAPDAATQYETARITDWFDHYLRGSSVSTGPLFSWFRDWVPYSGNAAPAYAASSRFPVGSRRTWYLSGDGVLADTAAGVVAGSPSLVTPPAGLPTGVDPVDVVGSFSAAVPDGTEGDAPGTAAYWTTPVLTAPLDVVGSPTLDVHLSAPGAALSQSAGPGGQLVLFVKLVDIDASGTAHLIKGQVAPVRIADASAPVHVVLPGIVHRFPAGDRVELAVSGGATNYRGGLVPTPVTVPGTDLQQLSLPVTG